MDEDDPLCKNCGHHQSMHSDGHGQIGQGPCDCEPGRGPGHQEYCDCDMYEAPDPPILLGVAAWEWICPCGTYNTTHDFEKPVKCARCDTTYTNTEIRLPWD